MKRPLVPVYLAIGFCVPGVVLVLSGAHLSAPLHAITSGLAILAASFILLWACDTAQHDISQSLALAVVALVAVLPEYAVDMYFTWQAGLYPEQGYAEYAIANMTGANRLIIGVAWALVVLIAWLKTRKPIRLDKERATEITFLAAATVYAFLIPLKGSLAWYDGLVLMGLYGWYLLIACKRPCEACEVDGPAAYLCTLPKAKRRLSTVVLFTLAAGVILANAEHFCEGLLGTGKALGISEFLLVQWLAPIASEAPEFTVAIMLALRGASGVALGSLLSAKLNQWTLLVGMIPAVYGVARGTFAEAMPLSAFQFHELLLTAAQSLLAVVLIARLRLSIGHAFLLFVLFLGQLFSPSLLQALPGGDALGLRAEQMHIVFSIIYIAAALVLLLHEPVRLKRILGIQGSGKSKVDRLATEAEG